MDAEAATDVRSLSRTAKSCGSDAPMLASSWRSNSAGDGDNEPGPPGRARSKAATPRSRSTRSPRPTWWRCSPAASPSRPGSRRPTRAGCGGRRTSAYGTRPTTSPSRTSASARRPPGRAGSSAPTGTACRRRGRRSSCRGATPGPARRPSQAGARYAYVPHMLWDAQRGENQLSITRRPLPGDLPVFDLDGDGVADHVGMFDDWTGQPGTTFCTIEGNVLAPASRTAAGSRSSSAAPTTRDGLRARARLIAVRRPDRTDGHGPRAGPAPGLGDVAEDSAPPRRPGGASRRRL